jgi:hypothetical protein
MAEAEGVAQLVAEDLLAVQVAVAAQVAACAVLDDDVPLDDAVEDIAIPGAGAVGAVASRGQHAARGAVEGSRDLVVGVVPADGVAPVARVPAVGCRPRVGEVDGRGRLGVPGQKRILELGEPSAGHVLLPAREGTPGNVASGVELEPPAVAQLRELERRRGDARQEIVRSAHTARGPVAQPGHEPLEVTDSFGSGATAPQRHLGRLRQVPHGQRPAVRGVALMEGAQDGLEHAEGSIRSGLEEQEGALADREARHAEEPEPGAARHVDPDAKPGLSLHRSLHFHQVIRGEGGGLDPAHADDRDDAGLIGQVLVRHSNVGHGAGGRCSEPRRASDRQPGEMSEAHSRYVDPGQSSAPARSWANRS